MPAASFDGLVVDRSHSLALDEITRRIELAAEDLAKGSLASHNPKITRPSPQTILLSGNKGGSAYEALITIDDNAVKVELKGKLELTSLQMMFVGGEAGVRKRVRTEVENALDERIKAS